MNKNSKGLKNDMVVNKNISLEIDASWNPASQLRQSEQHASGQFISGATGSSWKHWRYSTAVKLYKQCFSDS